MNVTTKKTHRPTRPQTLSALETLETRVVLAADVMCVQVTSTVEEVEVGASEEMAANLDMTGAGFAHAKFAEAGDFNADGTIDAVDIDMLSAAMSEINADTIYDLTLDGVVNMDDMDLLIRDILDTEYGDTDLDGQIDVVDFWMMNRNMFTRGGGWAKGDFNFDGRIDGSDFNVWNQYKDTNGPVAVASSPRPTPVHASSDAEDKGEESSIQDKPIKITALAPAHKAVPWAKLSVKARSF